APLPAHHLGGEGEARQQRRGTARRRHQGGRDRQGGQCLDPRAGVQRPEMRALLAPSAGSRVQSRTSHHLQPLRGQSRRPGRISHLRMTDAPHPPLAQSGIRLLWIAALVIAVDQLSKWWIVHHLAIGESIEVLPVFAILRTFNLGAAWSMFADAGGAQRWLFTVLAVAVSAALVDWLRRLALSTHTLLATGLALILGGALGNALDRVRLGHVVDFFFAPWGDSKFPVFNVADSAISVGAVLVVLDALQESRREKQATQAPK